VDSRRVDASILFLVGNLSVQSKAKPKKYVHTFAHRCRVVQVLLNEFRTFFIVFIGSVTLSTALLFSFYPPEIEKLSLGYATHSTLCIMFFNSPIKFVDDWRISWLFFVLPFLGLATIAQGVVNLSNVLFLQKRNSPEWQKMLAKSFENHSIVCGLGNVGVRVVEHLVKFGEPVVVIEKDPESRFTNEMVAYQVPVLQGDARDLQMLEMANIGKAKALLAVTDNDLVNLETVLTARDYNPNIRVVMRMFDQKLAKQIEKTLGIKNTYSSSARSARLFAQAAISGDILDSFEFAGTVINAVQLVLESGMDLVGQTIDDVRQHEVTVLLHEKATGELDWNPSPSNTLNVGDKLLIMTDRDGINRLEGKAKKKLTRKHATVES
jgi:voltage-gated potassium channel